jgi:hypothetical protein
LEPQVPQLDQPSNFRFEFRQGGQGTVYGQQFVGQLRLGDLVGIQRHTDSAATSLLALLTTSHVD